MCTRFCAKHKKYDITPLPQVNGTIVKKRPTQTHHFLPPGAIPLTPQTPPTTPRTPSTTPQTPTTPTQTPTTPTQTPTTPTQTPTTPTQTPTTPTQTPATPSQTSPTTVQNRPEQHSIQLTYESEPVLPQAQSESLEDQRDEEEAVKPPDHDKKSDLTLIGSSIEKDSDPTHLEDHEANSLPVDIEEVERRPRTGVIPLPTNYDEKSMDDIEKHPKAPEDDKLIQEAIGKNDFLNKILTGKLLKEVVDSMYNREIKAKEVIIKEGEKGSHMYVSAQGRYEVTIKGKGIVNTFEDIRVFGELAILYNDKRNATIKAIKPGRVWVLDRSVYQKLMVRFNIREQDEMLEFLHNVPKLNQVSGQVLQRVTTLLKVEFFTPGATIVKQGDIGNKFYIIRVGTVTISKEGEGVVANYGKGRYFGELALLKEEFRQATVVADAPGVECLTLTRQHFIDHFGELSDNGILTVKPPSPKISVAVKVKEHQDVQLEDLKIAATLGIGGFGRVELVEHKTRSLTFALKYLKKADMVEQNQQEHVYNERNIQIECRSKFIVRLYRSYKDSKYIYFLMESCLGGDLWTLLQRQKNHRFDEKDSRFIAGCVLEAFAYLHERGVVYRDLKPENILIDENGYVKLTDFGFAKNLGSRGRTFTFAGTPEYVAPEIILSRGHDKAVDYWAFGIFIFELLTGKTPFRTSDPSHMRTYNKILSGIDNVDFPSVVQTKARNVIEKLCKSIPTERLGCQKNGTRDIKNHRWFLGFDWNKLNDGKMAGLFKPKLKSAIDTKYFEEFKADNDYPPDETSGWDEHF